MRRGEPGKLTGSRFRYTGQILIAELGLYHYKPVLSGCCRQPAEGARTYSPWLGRFLQTDPIGYGDGPNPYAYTHNDPINGRDPWGLRTICCQVDDSHYEDRVWVITWTERCTEFPNEWFSPSLYFGSVDHVVEASPEPKTPPQNPNQPCSASAQAIAWTPDGDTKDDNPTPQGGRWNTDLPSGYAAAMAVFEGLSRLDAGAGGDGGYRANLDPRRPTTTLISNTGNIGLRWGIKGGSIVWRVDIAAGTFCLKKAETIQFNGQGRGNMCPTS